MASGAVVSQCQAVAGPLAALSFGESQAVSGLRLQPARSGPALSARSARVVAMAPKKKGIKLDDVWSKKWYGAGYFSEGGQAAPVNIAKTLEKKKILSSVEKAGLLSKAESVGLSLSGIEKAGLLSKAESLGLLGLAENFATSSPAALASLSLPFLVGAIAFPILISDETSLLLVAQYTLAALSGALGATLFVGSIVLSGLQAED
eukprot:SM000001S04512  [mRNA]  locus=s1:593566:594666:- [translate_table: standard]